MVPAGSNPPENPYADDTVCWCPSDWREPRNGNQCPQHDGRNYESERSKHWCEGFASRQPEIDRLEADLREAQDGWETESREKHEWIENLRQMRAERDAAIAAGQKLADLVTLLGGYDGPGYLAAPNQGERPDYVAAARLFSKIMRDETNGAAAALAAWRSVSGSGEPRTDDHTQECRDAMFMHHAATGGDMECTCKPGSGEPR